MPRTIPPSFGDISGQVAGVGYLGLAGAMERAFFILQVAVVDLVTSEGSIETTSFKGQPPKRRTVAELYKRDEGVQHCSRRF